MRLLKPLCAAFASIVFASSAFGFITAGPVGETLTAGDNNNQSYADNSIGIGELWPLRGTATQQSSYTEPKTASGQAGYTTSSQVQVTYAFSYSTDETQYPFTPSGHSYDFAFSTYEFIGLNGQVDVSDPTFATADMMTTFTLDTPTTWHLSEDAGEQTNNVTTDLFFRGAELYAGGPPQPGDNRVSIIPNFYAVFDNGGEASGVLNPGTYTYITAPSFPIPTNWQWH